MTSLFWYNVSDQTSTIPEAMLVYIIHYLLQLIQALYQQNILLLNLISKYIPLKQWAFDDSNSPKYQKFKVDELPVIEEPLPKLSWKKIVADYPSSHNGKMLKPIRRRTDPHLSQTCKCPRCYAPVEYIYRNNGQAGQLLCKVCGTAFFENVNTTFSKLHLRCPYCSHSLSQIKERKHFVIHKCVNPKCSYYIHNLKSVSKEDLDEDYGKTGGVRRQPALP